jgi:predicted DNA-binding transcriptional regulator YafY
MAYPGPTVQVDTPTTVAQACRDRERVRFAYTDRDGTGSDRLAEPHHLVALGRRWYLVAWDLDRHDWRSFRLDRLQDPTSTGAAFRPRALPGDDPAAFVQASIASAPARHEVEVLVAAPADPIRRRVGQWAEVETVGDASCRVRMRSDDLVWPSMLLAALDADFEVVAPTELVEQVQRTGERFRTAGRVPVRR